MPHQITVPVPPDRAFATFTEGMTAWWPPEYTWAHKTLEEIAIEPREGGHCFERGPHGFRCDWGRILLWDPPRRLVFTWQIGPGRQPIPDDARAGEVEVRFRDIDGGHCRVELEHRDFGKYGQDGDDYRAAMESPQGWPYILESYRQGI